MTRSGCARSGLLHQDWTLIDVYRDAAISGATTVRPGYQALIEDARNATFDVIVAEALDRLSRDQEDVAATVQADAIRRGQDHHPWPRARSPNCTSA